MYGGDFRFANYGFSLTNSSSAGSAFISALGITTFSQRGAIATDGTNIRVRKFSSGESIGSPGSSLGTNTNADAFLIYNTAGGGTNSGFNAGFTSSTGFMGVQTRQGNFGWIQVHVSARTPGNPSSLTIIDYAYDDSGAHIRAGDTGIRVPEPATAAMAGLGLLAMGAAGVRRMRKRKLAA